MPAMICGQCGAEKVWPVVGAHMGEIAGYMCSACEACFKDQGDGTLAYTGQNPNYIIGPAGEAIPITNVNKSMQVARVYVPRVYGQVSDPPSGESFEDIKMAWLKSTGQL